MHLHHSITHPANVDVDTLLDAGFSLTFSSGLCPLQGGFSRRGLGLPRRQLSRNALSTAAHPGSSIDD